MDELRTYEVDFIGLRPEGEVRHYVADDAWFQAVGGTLTRQGSVEMDVEIRPREEGFDLTVRFSGNVTVACDRCLESMQQPVSGEATLRIKLGEATVDDGDTITVAATDGVYNIAWNLYEQIALAIPMRHVHEQPCGYAATDDNEPSVDPRWEALRGLKENNNQ